MEIRKGRDAYSSTYDAGRYSGRGVLRDVAMNLTKVNVNGQAKKILSVLLVLTIVVSMLSGFPIFWPKASAATYMVTARVDESIGLRASASIGTAVGITPLDTRLIRPNATMVDSSGNPLPVKIAPYAKYTLNKVVIAAIATITHANGTKDSVKDVTTYDGLNVSSPNEFNSSYSVPNFSGYGGDSIDVEVIVYADFTYTAAAADYTINLTAGTVTANTGGSSGDIPRLGTTGQNARVFVIEADSAALKGKTIEVTGTSTNTGTTNATATNYQIYIRNNSNNAENRRVDLILRDATMLVSYGMTTANYKTAQVATAAYQGNSFTAAAAGDGNTNRLPNGTVRTSYSPITLAGVDLYLTLKGNNILATGSTYQCGGATYQTAIGVDASSSLIVTDASNGASLYTRGGGCGACIGTGGNWPAGYMQFDGGGISAACAATAHCFSGIGNGGHYTLTDPGIRGIVVNGGKVSSIGFHIGMGGMGGTAASYNAGVGLQYVVVTGGEIESEGSAGSAGAAIGFSRFNELHEVRIGRPDKGDFDSEVIAVNWGYGAAISGKTTFYSGTTKAYSGQYAAAIGGNAVSAATTSAATTAQATAGASSVGGTPLTVYGGNVTAEAGAFTQYVYANTSVDQFRGSTTPLRTSISAINGESRPSESYGAAIGGAIARAGGTTNYIFGGTINVLSSTHGAGIGGGGGFGTQAGGSGGNTWIGNLYDNNDSGKVSKMDFTIRSGRYGAGIGGGGSGGNAGGSGGNLYISGGSFDIQSGEFGAGIGGGGTNAASANGGNGGNVVISGNKFGWVDIRSGIYGAGIGGGGSSQGSAGSGGDLLIDCKTDETIIAQWYGDLKTGGVDPSVSNFNVTSGQFGAGIGGGGSYTGSGGAGANLLTINGGNFGIIAGDGPKEPSCPVSESFGAGIGGGGSYSGAGGNGPVKATINGGYFDVFSRGYGAAIGGGGCYGTNPAGGGGTAFYYGGTVVVQVPDGMGSVGMGGGHNPTGVYPYPYSRTTNGEVTILGGNISTEITSEVAGDATQHAWTLPFPGKNTDASYAGKTSTTTAIKIVVDKGLIGEKVNQVAFLYGGTTYYTYGIKDLFITEGEDDAGKTIGIAWIWVPSYLMLTYDLTCGVPDTAYTGTMVTNGQINNFKIDHATRQAVGSVKLTMYGTNDVKTYSGEEKTLMKWNDLIESGEIYDGAFWGAMAPNPPFVYHTNGGNELFRLTEHDPGPLRAINPNTNVEEDVPVLLIGWTDEKGYAAIKAKSGGANHIFSKNESGWNYKDYIKYTVQFSTDDIEVYAMWGYDANFNDYPDVLEGDYRLFYNANVPASTPAAQVPSVPSDPEPYQSGKDARVATNPPRTNPASSNPPRSGYVFVGWTTAVKPDLDINTVYDDTSGTVILTGLGTDLYIGAPGSALTGSYKFSSGGTDYGTIEGKSVVRIGGSNVTLYALWAVDSNKNGIPDFLEPKRQLIHDGRGADPNTVPEDKPYVDGNIGTSAYNGNYFTDPPFTPVNPTPMSYPNTAVGAGPNIFLGWTEDDTFPALLIRADKGITLPADLADAITLGSEFNGSDMTVYAVWAEDTNNTGIPDFLEGGYRFIYDPKTTDFIEDLPLDLTVYYENTVVDDELNDEFLYNFDITDIYASKPFDPYMQRDGWVFLGWLDYEIASSLGLINHDFTEVAAEAYKADPSNGVYPDIGLPFLEAPLATTVANWLTDFKFIDDDISIYAVWGEDKNNNGVPDWYDIPGRYVQYMPNAPVTGLEIKNMPGTQYKWGAYDVWIDNKGSSWPTGALPTGGYTTYETAKIDNNSVPTAEGYIFMGWTPIYFGGTAYGLVAPELPKTEFYKHLTLMQDVHTRTGANVSTLNDVASSSGGPSVPYAPVRYTLTPGTESLYMAARTAGTGTSVINAAYGGFDWLSNFKTGMGFPDSVTFDAFSYPKMDLIGGAEWRLWAVWAVDANNNGIPDMFETAYSLLYNPMGGTGGPVDEMFAYLPGQTAYVDRTAAIGKKDANSNSMIFLGWTAASSWNGVPIKPYYSAGEIDILPPRTSGVRFGNFDITVYAVWAVDLNNNGIPDVFEAMNFKVTYHANGGIYPPVDNGDYPYNTEVTVLGKGMMTNGTKNFLGWNTRPDGTGDSYAVGSKFQIRANITLYAQWEDDGTYTVIYDANSAYGGTGTLIDANSPYASGANVTVLDPTDGTIAHSTKIFAGWNTEADGTGTDYAAGDVINNITANIILYAQWEEDDTGIDDEYTVTYNANGADSGAVPVDSSTYLANASVTVLGNIGTPPLAKTGYIFDGWNTEADGSGTAYAAGGTFTMPANNVILYAQWEEEYVGGDDEYTVTYNANGGTGTLTDPGSPYKDGTEVTVLDKGSMTNGTKAFVGWNTSADGSGTAYAAGAKFIIRSDIELFAQWVDTYGVIYDPNGADSGAVPVDINRYKIGDTVTVLGNIGNLAKTGYTFVGWRLNPVYQAGETFTFTGNSDITLYAQWEFAIIGYKELDPAGTSILESDDFDFKLELIGFEYENSDSNIFTWISEPGYEYTDYAQAKIGELFKFDLDEFIGSTACEAINGDYGDFDISFYFKITEIAGSDADWTYDSSVYYVKLENDGNAWRWIVVEKVECNDSCDCVCNYPVVCDCVPDCDDCMCGCQDNDIDCACMPDCTDCSCGCNDEIECECVNWENAEGDIIFTNKFNGTPPPPPPPPPPRPELPPPSPPGIIVIPQTTTSGDTIPGIPYTPKKQVSTTEKESATEEEPTAEEPAPSEPTIEEPAAEEPTTVEIATVEPTAPPAAIGEPETAEPTAAPTTIKDSGDVAVPDKTDVDAGPSGPEDPEKDNPKTGDMVLPGLILAMLTTISIGIIVARKKRYTV